MKNELIARALALTNILSAATANDSARIDVADIDTVSKEISRILFAALDAN